MAGCLRTEKKNVKKKKIFWPAHNKVILLTPSQDNSPAFHQLKYSTAYRSKLVHHLNISFNWLTAKPILLMQVMPMLHDQQLIARYMDGDEQAFEVLLSRYKAKIYTSIYLFVKDRALAEDIFQEVFIKIIDTLRKGKYNHEGKFVQWAMRISYNMCVDYHRRNKRRAHINPSEDFDIFEVLRVGNDGADTNILRSETHNHIRKLVDSLPPEQREVVILRHYADMSFKEIASLTRVSINTALGRMRYALINIRKMMSEREVVLQ